MLRIPFFCLLLGACWVAACGEQFRAESGGEGGSPEQGEGGAGDEPSTSGGKSVKPPVGGGGEGGEAVEPVGGQAGSAMGGMAGAGGIADMAGSAGSGGLSGSGGVGGGPIVGSCDLPVGAKVILEEHFQTNVFQNPIWLRSHDSVMVDGQQLLIAQDTILDDYAEVQPSLGELPLVVQVRAAMMTSGQAHRWPVVDLIPADNSAGRITINYQNGVNAGWQFTKQDNFTGSMVNAPASATFMTVRAFINQNGGTLCSKADNQDQFVKVASAEWDFGPVFKVRLRQAWDEICRFDDLIVYK